MLINIINIGYEFTPKYFILPDCFFKTGGNPSNFHRQSCPSSQQSWLLSLHGQWTSFLLCQSGHAIFSKSFIWLLTRNLVVFNCADQDFCKYFHEIEKFLENVPLISTDLLDSVSPLSNRSGLWKSSALNYCIGVYCTSTECCTVHRLHHTVWLLYI